jgi:hypothetical protein
MQNPVSLQFINSVGKRGIDLVQLREGSLYDKRVIRPLRLPLAFASNQRSKIMIYFSNPQALAGVTLARMIFQMEHPCLPECLICDHDRDRDK